MASNYLQDYRADPRTRFLRSEEQAVSLNLIIEQPVYYFLDWLSEEGYEIVPRPVAAPTGNLDITTELDLSVDLWEKLRLPTGGVELIMRNASAEIKRLRAHLDQPAANLQASGCHPMTAEPDILDRLKRWLAMQVGQHAQDVTDAIAEIEQLRRWKEAWPNVVFHSQCQVHQLGRARSQTIK